MDSKIIQKRVEDLVQAMLAKGMREPDANLWFVANSEPTVFLKWKASGSRSNSLGEQYEFIKGKFPGVFDKASAFIAKRPNAEQARMQDFMSALGSVIDLGRQNNIEVEFLNPLVATMKTLSENVITDQRAA